LEGTNAQQPIWQFAEEIKRAIGGYPKATHARRFSAMDTEPGLRIMGSWSFCFPRTWAV
jgi:hypothetical protein